MPLATALSAPPDGRYDPSVGLPAHYTTLAPFRSLFLTGLPMLVYHKLGPRPRGTRLKGLYVGEDLFRRQLAELAAAGFRSGSLGDGMAAAVDGAPPRIVLTFDDGFENVLRLGAPVLHAHGFTAIQFLVADLLGQTNEWEQREGEVAERLMDAAQVRDWLAGGHDIGAHTCTHPRLTRVPPAQAREEIVAGKSKLEDLFGRPIRHFCYPYGDWNPAVRDLVQAAGYETACTSEPGINLPTADRLALKRFMARYRSRNWANVWRAVRGWLSR